MAEQTVVHLMKVDAVHQETILLIQIRQDLRMDDNARSVRSDPLQLRRYRELKASQGKSQVMLIHIKFIAARGKDLHGDFLKPAADIFSYIHGYTVCQIPCTAQSSYFDFREGANLLLFTSIR